MFSIFGVFPEKIIKVVRIFKTESKAEVNNYCPSSILSNFSKIFETLAVVRLSNFLKKTRCSTRYSMHWFTFP